MRRILTRIFIKNCNVNIFIMEGFGDTMLVAILKSEILYNRKLFIWANSW